MNKKMLIIICGLLISIILILFFSFHYKIGNIGNNISKSTDDIVRYILNINSYEAKISVTIESNKTINKYELKQLYSKPNLIKQTVEIPNNLSNLTLIYDGKSMKVENTQLSLTKIYEDYKYISQNTLWLSTFIDNYNDKSKIKDVGNEILIENDNKYNEYNIKQVLYINKKTVLPTKLIIYDNNQNTKIYIEYNEIQLNKVKQNEIIAFRLEKTNL